MAWGKVFLNVGGIPEDKKAIVSLKAGAYITSEILSGTLFAPTLHVRSTLYYR